MKRAVLLSLLLFCAAPSPAFAHSAGRGFVLLLPTSWVISGGALAVLASFVLVSWAGGAREFKRGSEPAAAGGSRFLAFTSLFGAAVLAALIVVGFIGPRDPLENLLPLAIWTLWWVVIVLLHPVLGNLWLGINPFTGLHAVLASGKPLMKLPPGLAYVPAVIVFAAFAWFQLVDPAPEDPHRLAWVVLSYFALTLAAVFVFGPAEWLGKGDPFAIFLRQLAAAAPWSAGKFAMPGQGLLSLPALPLAGTLFVLLTLSSISFDGFANTFLWLSSVGVNPLDYPGRTAMMAANTMGLAAAFAALAFVYTACIWLGRRWSGVAAGLEHVLGRFVLSLIPISIAYHFAHYLGDTLLKVQYLPLAINDPLETGADLLGLEGFHPTASFQNTASGAVVLFGAETAAIVIGHIIAVFVAHAMARAIASDKAAALRLELPLAAFMVIYTGFGLWLLATPAIS